MSEQQVIVFGEGNLVLLGSDLPKVSKMEKPPQQRSGVKTYSVAAKLGHDGLHGLLVLFEQ